MFKVIENVCILRYSVAAHLIQVAKASHDKKFELHVRMQGRTLLQQMSDKNLPHPFIEEEISAAL